MSGTEGGGQKRRAAAAVVDLTLGSSDDEGDGNAARGMSGTTGPKRRRRKKGEIMEFSRANDDDSDDSDVELVENTAGRRNHVDQFLPVISRGSSFERDGRGSGRLKDDRAYERSDPKGGGSSFQQDVESSQKRLRHKQQRLLLLHHASKCRYEDGQCPVTSMCGGMKRLWAHISDCMDQQCKVQYCMSSRYVLSHYRRCKDARCQTCEPVRDVIRRSQARAEAAPDRKAAAAEIEARMLNEVSGQSSTVSTMSSSSYVGGSGGVERSVEMQPPNKRARTSTPSRDGMSPSGSVAVAGAYASGKSRKASTGSVASSNASSKQENVSQVNLKDDRAYDGDSDDDDRARSTIDDDYALAQALQNEENNRLSHKKDEEKSARYAAKLQREEESRAAQLKVQEEAAMNESASGKAVLFVQKILAIHQRLQTSTRDASVQQQIDAVSRDDMVALVEAMINLQATFAASGRPCSVDIGFHYTTPQNMDKIRESGLMTKADRTANNVSAAPRGSVFGDGIYTGNNPYCFQHFGTIGLLVARLQGNVERSSGMNRRSNISHHANTVVGNKIGANRPYFDEVVLQQSAQCVPLARYASTLIEPRRTTSLGNEIVRVYHKELQIVVDSFFNAGKKTEVLRYLTPSTAGAGAGATGASASTATSTARNAAAAAAANATVNAAMASLNAQMAAARTALASVSASSAALPAPASVNATLMAASASASGGFLASASASAPSAAALFPGAGLSGGLSAAPSFAGTTISAGRRQRVRHGVPGSGSGSVSTTAATAASHSGSEVISYKAPTMMAASTGASSFERVSSSQIEDGAECSICLDDLCSRRAVKIKCGHIFHKRCIGDALSRTGKNSCPVCRKLLGEPQGAMPSGTMRIVSSSVTCQGFQGHNSYVITYQIPSGVQSSYMAQPGQRFTGATRNAYVPDTTEGRSLLKRLKYAFWSGLTFVVGTSMTTGATNVVTWSSIHHKSSPSGGARAHGFPDPGYFANVNEELDNLGVPAANDIDDTHSV